jgi:putative ABC transport system ATP-binding protein
VTQRAPIHARGDMRRASEHPVVFEDVDFAFHKSRPLLRSVRWVPDFGDGPVLLRGRSGSGKTTVLHLVSGLVQARAGSVTTLGLNMTTAADRDRRGLRATSIGHVYQDFRLLPELTAGENVALPLWLRHESPDAAREPARRALDTVDLAWAVNRRPEQLSGGEQQRVALARALVAGPQIVLADEPTANLDDESAATVVALLGSVAASGVAVIVATHDARFAASSRRVFELTASGAIEAR